MSLHWTFAFISVRNSLYMPFSNRGSEYAEKVLPSGFLVDETLPERIERPMG
jgi:hypothetical protein